MPTSLEKKEKEKEKNLLYNYQIQGFCHYLIF